MNVLRKLAWGAWIVGLGAGLVATAHAADATKDEVYQAVRENRLDDAQAMMAQVLRNHPNSAEAHYIDAEVLVRMGRTDEARGELDQAERLEPGLPFARPSAVRSLQALLAERGARRDSFFNDAGAPRAAGGGVAWGVVLLVVAGVGLVMFLLARARRAAVLAGPALPSAGAYGPGYAPAYPYGGAPMAGPGLGSSIVGGLATGAAVGAGVVAGEALAHELMGGHHAQPADLPPADASRLANDDGGRDFGVNDPDSGWDSGGMGGDIAGGGGDWS